METQAHGSECYKVGDLVVDVTHRRVLRDEKAIPLPRLSFNLFLVLIRAGPNLVTNEELLSNVWKDKVVGLETVRQRVKLVRDALSDNASTRDYIDVVWGEGYRLCDGVESIADEPADAIGRLSERSHISRIFQLRVLVAVGLAVAAAMFVTVTQLTKTPTLLPTSRASLAVMQTINLTGDLASNEIGTTLGIRVRTELGRLGSVDITIPATAEYLLRSAMIRSGENSAIRYAVSLIEKEGGKTIWSGFFDRSTQSVEQFADNSASEVVRNIQLSLLPSEESRLAVIQPGSNEIDLLHSAGREALSDGNLQGAFDSFTAIIELQPNRAQAHSDLARALIKMGWYTEVSSGEVIPRAEVAARSALRLDPSLAEPYLVLANAAAFYHWDWERADELYIEALARNPRHAPIYLDYAAYLFVVGRMDEGLQQIRQAELVDPFSADTQGQIGVLYHYIRRWEAAHRHYDTAISLQPDNLVWQVNKGCTYIFEGDFDRGSALIGALRSGAPDNPMPMVIDAYLAAVTGDNGRAQLLLDRLDTEQLAPISKLMRASIYVALQRNKDAVKYLQLAKNKRLLALPFSTIHPTHDPLRRIPEYTDLLSTLGLRPISTPRTTDTDTVL